MLVISRAESSPSRSITGVIKPLSGKHEILSLLCFHNHGLARRAHARIDDHDKHGSRRIVRRNAGQESRAVLNGKRCHLVRDVHDARIRRDTHHDRFADCHGIVGRAKVGHEDDGRRESWRCRCRGICPGASVCRQPTKAKSQSMRTPRKHPARCLFTSPPHDVTFLRVAKIVAQLARSIGERNAAPLNCAEIRRQPDSLKPTPRQLYISIKERWRIRRASRRERREIAASQRDSIKIYLPVTRYCDPGSLYFPARVKSSQGECIVKYSRGGRKCVVVSCVYCCCW